MNEPVVTLPDMLSAEELHALLNDVWLAMLGDELGLGEPIHTVNPALVAMAREVVASVSITGSWNGHIELAVSSRGAQLIAQAAFGYDDTPVSQTEIADIVGELDNILAGNVKATLPEPSLLSLPVVVFGAAAYLLPNTVLRLATIMMWRGTPVLVSIREAGAPRPERLG